MKHYIDRAEDRSIFYPVQNVSNRYKFFSTEEIVEQVLEKALENKFETNRKPHIENVQRFSSDFLNTINQNEDVTEAAFSAFYKKELSLESAFVDFALRKITCSAQMVNWKQLANLYTLGSVLLNNLDFCPPEEMFDLECPVSMLFSSNYPSLNINEALLHQYKKSTVILAPFC